MPVRHALIWAAVLSLLTVLTIFTIDHAVAASLADSVKSARGITNPVITALEYIFLFPVSKFAFGALFVLAAMVAFFVAKWRPVAWLLLFIGATHLSTRLIAGVLKNVFLRARPGEAVQGFFVEGGSSFPSGHAAHFWALFFALAMVFPKLRIPALVLALLVSASRVVVNDHFVSDVLASGAIAALVCAGYAAMMRRRITSPPAR